MSRTTFATLTLLALLALTALTGSLSEGHTGPGALAAVAFFKIALIGAVFLELDRAWRGWAILSALLIALLVGGAAVLIPASGLPATTATDR